MMNSQVPDVIVQSKPPSTEALTVFVGFPGSGLVGSIALSYIVEKLEFSQTGVITSKYFPPHGYDDGRSHCCSSQNI